MLKLALTGGLRCLVVLPAVAVFGISLLLAAEPRGPLAPGEPLVLIAEDAGAFMAAMAPEFSNLPERFSADIVVVLPAMPAMPGVANLILVDIGARRKLWTTIAVQRLRDIFARIGEPA